MAQPIIVVLAVDAKCNNIIIPILYNIFLVIY